MLNLANLNLNSELPGSLPQPPAGRQKINNARARIFKINKNASGAGVKPLTTKASNAKTIMKDGGNLGGTMMNLFYPQLNTD